MTRILITSLIYLIVIVVICLFLIKLQTQSLHSKLLQIESQIQAEKEHIHILKAELAYLSKPQLIEQLATFYLNLYTMKQSQIISLESLKLNCQ